MFIYYPYYFEKINKKKTPNDAGRISHLHQYDASIWHVLKAHLRPWYRVYRMAGARCGSLMYAHDPITVVTHRINCRSDTLAAATVHQPVKTWAINRASLAARDVRAHSQKFSTANIMYVCMCVRDGTDDRFAAGGAARQMLRAPSSAQLYDNRRPPSTIIVVIIHATRVPINQVGTRAIITLQRATAVANFLLLIIIITSRTRPPLPGKLSSRRLCEPQHYTFSVITFRVLHECRTARRM